jgi:import receptor subunit TOM20
LRELTPGAFLPGPFDSSYCSEDCQHKAAVQYDNLLFTLSDPLPEMVIKTQTNVPPKDKRKEAQEKFAAHLKEFGKAAPLLVAKFIGRQFAVETNKLLPAENRDSDITDSLPEDEEYNLNDHMERYR